MRVAGLATLFQGPLFFSACVFVLLVLVGWLFVPLKKGRAASARPAEGPPPSDEMRALFIKLEQELERKKGARVLNMTPETGINQTDFGNSVHRATHSGDRDLKADLDRAEADLRAMKALLAEVSVERDNVRQQRDDARHDRDDWRSQAEHGKTHAQRRTLTLPAPHPAQPATTLEPPSRRSWWPWRRRASAHAFLDHDADERQPVQEGVASDLALLERAIAVEMQAKGPRPWWRRLVG
jgi:hypothetical protein